RGLALPEKPPGAQQPGLRRSAESRSGGRRPTPVPTGVRFSVGWRCPKSPLELSSHACGDPSSPGAGGADPPPCPPESSLRGAAASPGPPRPPDVYVPVYTGTPTAVRFSVGWRCPKSPLELSSQACGDPSSPGAGGADPPPCPPESSLRGAAASPGPPAPAGRIRPGLYWYPDGGGGGPLPDATGPESMDPRGPEIEDPDGTNFDRPQLPRDRGESRQTRGAARPRGRLPDATGPESVDPRGPETEAPDGTNFDRPQLPRGRGESHQTRGAARPRGRLPDATGPESVDPRGPETEAPD
ncbi:hypothetical protein M9458_050838, partial [Cirrhinus mrigala]